MQTHLVHEHVLLCSVLVPVRDKAKSLCRVEPKKERGEGSEAVLQLDQSFLACETLRSV